MPVKGAQGSGGGRGKGKFKNIAKLAEELTKNPLLHFNKKECECLLNMMKFKLDRAKFREILSHTFGMTDDVLMDRVFRAFDKDSDSYVSPEEWVRGASIFLKGNQEEQIQFCFEVYDMNGDGYISREEMFQLLKHSLVKPSAEEDPDENVKDLLELTLKRMDYDHDSRLSLADFKQAIESENLLLEVLGQCLPEPSRVQAFLTLVAQDSDTMHFGK
ncbi:calaxin-like [Lineus longissimus]|uniref:calaxin-like n=1 Tax=Lineus longissimus TaxID=88925 RepID=UPI002B4C4320